MSEKQKLNAVLAPYQLRQVYTPPDGDCFFHALKMMLNLADDVQTMRVNVVDNMAQLMGKDVLDQGQATSVTSPFNSLLDTSRYATWVLTMLK